MSEASAHPVNHGKTWSHIDQDRVVDFYVNHGCPSMMNDNPIAPLKTDLAQLAVELGRTFSALVMALKELAAIFGEVHPSYRKSPHGTWQAAWDRRVRSIVLR